MEKKHTVGNVTAGFMIAGALLIDGLQALMTFTVLLLPLSIFLTFFAAIGFGLWFALMGVKYIGNDGGKKLLTALAATIAELAPVINVIPATTAGVIGIIVQTRIEDARKSMGRKVTPRTIMANARLRQMQRSRARQDAAREGRESAQETRHANDNVREESGREAA